MSNPIGVNDPAWKEPSPTMLSAETVFGNSADKNLKYKTGFGYGYDANTYRVYVDKFKLASASQNVDDKVTRGTGTPHPLFGLGKTH